MTVGELCVWLSEVGGTLRCDQRRRDGHVGYEISVVMSPVIVGAYPDNVLDPDDIEPWLNAVVELVEEGR